MRAIRSGVFWSVFVVLLTLSLHEVRLSMGHGFSDMVPMVEMGKVKTMIMAVNESRRKLNSFEVCSPCMCCGGGNKNYCLPSPCCYAINCNIPNRPFGFCSFTPKTCNCFECHI